MLNLIFRRIYCDGDQFEGGWRDGDWHGKGKFMYKNGSKEVGYWENGKRQGELHWYDKNGKVTKKMFEDGMEIVFEGIQY